jgi:membrane protein DedA with SNARE-associated domain
MLLLAISFDTIRNWITTQGFEGGVLIAFLLLFACGLGLPMPEDIPLIISGAFLCTTPTRWAVVGFACWAGIIGGDCCLYFMARRYGLEITRLPLIGKHVTRERIEYVEGLFEKYGVGVVAICRLFAGVRGAMVIAAGAIKYNFIKFIIADSIAAVVSGGMFMLLGYWVGSKINDATIREFKHYFTGGAIALAAIFIAWILWKRKKNRNAHPHPIVAVEEKVVDRLASSAHDASRPQG